jgi:hypothetical protein
MKKFFSITSLVFTLLLSSCSQDSFDTPEANKNTSSQFAKGGSNDEILKTNLETFYNQNKDFGDRISLILDKNTKFKGGNDFYQEINQAKSDSDILLIFNKYGLTVNTQDLLNLIKDKDALSQQFSNSNPYLYELDEATREEYLHEIVQKDVNSESLAGKVNCYQTYQTSRKRCVRTYAIASVAVVVAGPFTAGIVTAIGGAAAVAIYAACLGDANTDYSSCLNG